MARLLRVTGILFFAVMVAVSSRTLKEMHATGELFERYNSRTKKNITMLGASIVLVGVLGTFELTRSRRRLERRGFGRYMNASDRDLAEEEEKDIADIYSTPETIEAMTSHRRSVPRGSHRQTIELANVWMGLLRICCLVFPAIYLVLLIVHLLSGFSVAIEYWLVAGGFAFLALFSMVAAFGICFKKMWGYTCGYLLSVFNLVVFPVGTIFGLVMLVGLVGATPLFAIPEMRRLREKRKAAKRKEAQKRKEQREASREAAANA